MSLRSDDLNSVGELYTENYFRQLVVAIEATPAFLGGLGELEDHGERGLVGETSLGAHCAVADRRERAFDEVGRAQMLPVLGGEVVEGEQRVAILDQALDRLVVFDAPGFDEGVERGERILLGLGHPNLLQRPLGFRLLALGQLVQDVGGLVHPAALAARLRPHFLDRLPEAERAVGDRELGRHRKPAPFEVEEQFPPGLRALAHAVDEADKFLLAFGRGADDDQQALRGVLEPGLHVDAVDPEVDVALGREIALAPARVLVRPGVLEPPDGRGREPAGILAEQCEQRLLEVAGGDALEVEDRDQHLEALRSARIGRQNRRRKADVLPPSPPRSRTRGHRTATGPMPVMISRSGRCPWRTSRRRPSSVSLSAWVLSKPQPRPRPPAPAALARHCVKPRSADRKMFLAGLVGKR